MRVLHWFRNDLRVADNRAFARACADAEELIPAFVLDSRLLAASRDDTARLAFLRASLAALDRELRARGSRLLVLAGDPVIELARLVETRHVRTVTWNEDYSPVARARDAAVRAALERMGAMVVERKDRVVWDGREICNRAGGPYTVFTAYRRAWLERWRAEPAATAVEPARLRLPPFPADGADRASPLDALPASAGHPTPGAAAAERRLADFLEGPAARYAEDRDRPGLAGTSRLSSYLRLGAISVRQCIAQAVAVRRERADAAAGIAKWLDELVWREFYHAILLRFPRVHRRAFRPEFEDVAWRNDPAHFAAWCRGETGYPFVDAAMRELDETGWMHNRARMVVASFLTKDLLVDWRWGERHFKHRLIDWDPASNNGGWQWAASTGTDAQPYFRIFNPVRQGERFDPDGCYVRRWVPELRDVPDGRLHRPWAAATSPDRYPAPIVDHALQRREALARFKDAKARWRAGG